MCVRQHVNTKTTRCNIIKLGRWIAVTSPDYPLFLVATDPEPFPGFFNIRRQVPAWLAGVMAGRVQLCDPIQQLTLRSSVMGFPLRAILGFNLLVFNRM